MGEALSRSDVLAHLDGRAFDAVVIGGGINGVAVARDASLRGLSVCLLEQGDFASGTSSKSTKIAHGGLRYLRHLEFGLVRESQRERRVLRALLPHLVQPLSFCYPVYKGGPDAFWKVRLGVAVYGFLGGPGGVERHRGLSADAALAANPLVRGDGLTGAIRYWDDRMDDARICLETALSAEAAGAVCLSYVGAEEVRRDGRGFEVDYRDVPGGARGTVRCGAIVNCAGPWSDAVLSRLAGVPTHNLALTKGVHIVIPRLSGEDALILENPGDGRTFFAIPWEDATLVGTTDTRYEGDPAGVQVETEDVAYLLEAAGHYLPRAGIRREHVVHAFAGLRPLVAPRDASVAEGAISRRHRVMVGPEGVVTLIGGKYTTFRAMAEEATDALMEALGRPRGKSRTRTEPYFEAVAPKEDRRADPELWQWLAGRYGPRAGEAYDLCLSAEALRGPVIDGQPLRLGDIVYAVQGEKALTLGDVIYRRTRLAWRPELSAALVEEIAGAVAKHLPAGERLALGDAAAVGKEGWRRAGSRAQDQGV